jgi:predicted nucleic acid-binding protein
MISDGFRSYDAIHAATMQVAAVTDIATLDHGFTALPQTRARIHTAAALVPTMRKRRAG